MRRDVHRRGRYPTTSSRDKVVFLSLIAVFGMMVLLIVGKPSSRPSPLGAPPLTVAQAADAAAGTIAAARTTPAPEKEWGGAEVVALSSGFTMPAFGYGTCCRPSARGRAVTASTLAYLKAGGKLIDTAMAYANHANIGTAIKYSGLDRAELWLTSKISPNMVKSYDECLAAVPSILDEIGTEYLDLLLIHTPKLGKDRTVDLWRCLIEARARGQARAIGVSNFNWLEVEALEAATGVLPDVNQVQLHPWTPKGWRGVVDACLRRGVAVTAYTSLGGSRFRKAGSPWGEALAGLAAAHGATPAQVLLRWARQVGGGRVAVIPGSSSDEHIRENLRCPAFELSAAELAVLEASPPPHGWFDAARGPAKYDDAAATTAWGPRK